jgi:hypothetical protein
MFLLDVLAGKFCFYGFVRDKIFFVSEVEAFRGRIPK